MMYGGPLYFRERSTKPTLHRLVEQGDLQQIQKLADPAEPTYDPNCDINKKNDRGQTALHLAVSMGRQDIVTYLLWKNARTDITDNDGKMPLDLAQDNSMRKLFQREASPPINEAKATEKCCTML